MLTLAISDFRNIWRDGLLAFLILLPLFIALIYRLLIPDQQELEAMVQSRLPGDLEPYRAALTYAASAMEKLLMGIFIGMSPGLIGAVYGLLLVDERDQRTLAVLRVMPIAFAHYLLARLATPCILSILVTIAAYPLAGLAPLPAETVVAIGLVGATTVPVVVLSIVTFASTKVGALVVMRLVNGALALPFLAYFASPLQEVLAWPVPSFWQMKALWLASDGEPYLWVLALTPVINIPLAVWLYSRFARRNE
jgi:hypothetical protein